MDMGMRSLTKPSLYGCHCSSNSPHHYNIFILLNCKLNLFKNWFWLSIACGRQYTTQRHFPNREKNDPNDTKGVLQ
nr:MAG TPA: hypothetical protein [Bacteriophage sp.]